MKIIKTLSKIIVIAVIFLIILSVALFFFNKFYLSDILISKLTTLAEQESGRKVEIKNASFGLIKGLAVSGITISDEHSPQAAFLKIDTLSIQISFPPFRKDGKLNIPLSINSSNIELSIIRKTQNDFNFSSLKLFNKAKPATQKPKPKSKIAALPSSIQLKDIKIYFRDSFLEPTLSRIRTLHIKDIHTKFKLPLKLDFKLNGNITPGNTDLNITGEFFPTTKNLLATLNITNLPAEQYFAYYSGLPISIKRALLENMSMDISLKDKLLLSKTTIALKNVDLENSNLNLKGDFLINANTAYNLLNKNINYDGSLQAIDTYLSGITLLKEADEINGEIQFSKDLLETKNLTALIRNIPLSVEGKFYDFKNPYLYLRFSSDSDLSNFAGIFAEKLRNLSFKFKGASKLDLKLEGRTKEKKPLNYSGTLNLIDTQIIHPNLREPLNIQQTQLLLEHNIVSSKNINADYKNSSLKAKLSIDISDFDDAMLKASGDLNLDFSDLNSDKLTLLGSGKGNFKLDTKLGDLGNGVLDFNIDSDSLRVQGINLKNISAKYTQSNGSGKINISSLDTYDGAVKIAAEIFNPFAKNMSYAGDINIKEVNLAKLKLDTPLKNKEFSGILNLYARGQNETLNLNRLTGKGNIAIKDGHLWELKPLKALVGILNLHSLVKFSECAGNFLIKNNRVITEDLHLISEDKNIELGVVGSVAFNKQLDLTVKTKLKEDILAKEPTLKDIPEIIFGAGGSMLNINITGPWTDPQIKVIPAIVGDFEDVIKGGVKRLKGIFGDILE